METLVRKQAIVLSDAHFNISHSIYMMKKFSLIAGFLIKTTLNKDIDRIAVREYTKIIIKRNNLTNKCMEPET